MVLFICRNVNAVFLLDFDFVVGKSFEGFGFMLLFFCLILTNSTQLAKIILMTFHYWYYLNKKDHHLAWIIISVNNRPTKYFVSLHVYLQFILKTIKVVLLLGLAMNLEWKFWELPNLSKYLLSIMNVTNYLILYSSKYS